MIDSDPKDSATPEEQRELTFQDRLLDTLTTRLAENGNLVMDATRYHTQYEYEDPELGIVKIADYYDAAHNDEHMRPSSLRKTTEYLQTNGTKPIINIVIAGRDTYAVFRPKDVDMQNGIGQAISFGLPDNANPEVTIVTQRGQLVEHPEGIAALQALGS